MRFSNGLAVLWVAGVLAACGGGSGSTSQTPLSETKVAWQADAGQDLIQGQAAGVRDPTYGQPRDGVDRELMKQRLATHFNGQYAAKPEALMGDRRSYAGTKALWTVDAPYGGTSAPVHRFLNVLTGSHFYTMSSEEKVSIERSLPHYRYEGQGYFALTSSDAPLSPVFRFYSIYTGTHFYTIDPQERDFVEQNYSRYFTYEGVSWYATVFEGPGWVPMHRFFNNAAGTHFYTTSEEERLKVIATAPHMEYEGIAYYVRADGLPLRRSPVSGAFQANGDGSQYCVLPNRVNTPTAMCGTQGALPLPTQVEGRREWFVPGNYRFVDVPGQPYTDCATDRLTGLTWERKPFSGLRSVYRRFTHLDRTDSPQVVVRTAGGVNGTVINVPRNPTQAEIDAATNSLGYVNYVNSVALCGFTDWRIPTSHELMNIAALQWGHLGIEQDIWHFLSSDGAIWSLDQTLEGGEVSRSTVDGVISLGFDNFNPYQGQRPVDFGFRAVEEGGQLNSYAMYHLLLVRGAAVPESGRFTPLSIAYGADAGGNVVLDNWSGLQWRRCVEGQRWTGTSCTGTPEKLTLGGALSWAAARPGWRLAGAKELDSLRKHQDDLTQVQTYIDQFPMPGMNPFDLPFWSMSILMESEHREDPVGSGNWGFVQWLEALQLNYGATPAGSAPETFLTRKLLSNTGYVRLVRVHP